jgi:hypothetical protein
VDDEMGRLDQAAFNLGLDIQALEAQLVAINKYVRDTSAGTGMLPKDVAARAQVERELTQTQALKAQVDELAEQIQSERIQVGTNDYASQEDDRIRARLLAAVGTEARWLASNGSPVSASDVTALNDLDRRLAAYQKRARQLVDARVIEIKKVMSKEQRNVAGYDGQLVAYQGETESLGGTIAARSFRNVLDRIDAVVLEADIGLVDVAWKQKQDKSGSIGRMLDRQRTEFDALEQNFNEVAGD